MEVNRKMFTLL